MRTSTVYNDVISIYLKFNSFLLVPDGVCYSNSPSTPVRFVVGCFSSGVSLYPIARSSRILRRSRSSRSLVRCRLASAFSVSVRLGVRAERMSVYIDRECTRPSVCSAGRQSMYWRTSLFGRFRRTPSIRKFLEWATNPLPPNACAAPQDQLSGSRPPIPRR